jgi:hypothetical protein
MMMKKKILYVLITLVPSVLLAQWQPTNGPEGSTVNDIMKKRNFIFSCTGEFGGGGVYRSSDNRQSWRIIINRFEPTNKVNSLSANENFIFAGAAYNGVWRRLRPGVVSVNNPIDLQQVFHLEQNYPNPFNPTTTIRYYLEKGSKIYLRIYYVMGEGITTLVNDVKYKDLKFFQSQ